jgi:hypothetical protein
VPRGHVDYRARRRRDSDVAWFNFDLARDMGLIPVGHPDRLTPALRRALLDTFSLVIINEYDFLSGLRVPARDLLPHPYMATRYLQLQHPDGRGASSGDGRSVWNGCTRHAGVTWDVSSCGTGVTRLCPATSQHGSFFKTGNWQTDYGCGTATVEEGLCSALMSETFHHNGIATERVLAVLTLPSGQAINVRAAPNLLRPSHFFVHLGRGDLESLSGIVDFFIDRQISNGAWRLRDGESRPGRFAEEMALTFARVAATFESEYVFCWMDWDGDNILADGGIIDYGSVRQFGLYHREYRYEDVDRMSTSLPEQRRKARHIVQKCAQIRDFLETGHKPRLAALARDPVLAVFDAEFAREKELRLLAKLGFTPRTARSLRDRARPELERFARIFSRFERTRAARGPVKVADGLSWNAVYCMRDFLRELPARFAEKLADTRAGAMDEEALERLLLPARDFLGIAHSSYASRRDRACTPYRRRLAREYQRACLALFERAARIELSPLGDCLARAALRAAVVNHYARITGDGVENACDELLRSRKRIGPEGLYRVVRAFTDDQDLDPDRVHARDQRGRPALGRSESRLLARLVRISREFREGL